MQQLHTPSQAKQWLRERVQGNLHTDSRQVRAGDAFVAWPGAATDARQFIAKALEKGASACLAEAAGVEQFGVDSDALGVCVGLKTDLGSIASDFYGHPSRDVATVAVTGTNGKTSTSWWLAQALSGLSGAEAMPCGVIGTLGVGIPPDVVHTGLTTPDPVMLQRTLAEFRRHGVRACAMEASSIGIEEHRLAGCEIQVAVFTNFTQDHLDYHGSMQAYWQAKRKLFSWTGLRSAVINVDDAKGAELAQELTAAGLDVWSTSIQGPARMAASDVAYGAQGLQFDVTEAGQTVTVSTHLIGQYNVANVLGVMGAMRCLGVSLQAAAQACSTLRPVPGRLECLGGDQQPLVAVDYAHTPDALHQVLAALRPLAQQRAGQLTCVFGCGGDRDATKRPRMGAEAALGADRVIVTSDNPRGEAPASIIAQVLQGIPPEQSDKVQSMEDRAAAIAFAIAQAHPNDVVVLAGKGHETTQEIAGTKTAFSDIEHAKAALQAYRATTGVAA